MNFSQKHVLQLLQFIKTEFLNILAFYPETINYWALSLCCFQKKLIVDF